MGLRVNVTYINDTRMDGIIPLVVKLYIMVVGLKKIRFLSVTSLLNGPRDKMGKFVVRNQ